MNARHRSREYAGDGNRDTRRAWGGVAVLDRDGVAHNLRSARPEDAPAIRHLLDNLSPRSAYQRFLTACPRTAAYTTSLNDPGRTLDAVVVTAGSEIVALGSTHPLGAGRAEIALAIADEHQGHGLGTLVLEALVERARRRGLRTLVGDVLLANEQMLDVLRHLGLPYTISVDTGIAEVDIELADNDAYCEAVASRNDEARGASLSLRSGWECRCPRDGSRRMR